MSKKGKRKVTENPQLNMTPMIDVVFQLMIFFLVTLKHDDIMGHLDVNRPMGSPSQSDVRELLQVLVYKEGFVLQGRRVELKELDRQLSRIASFDKTTSIVIKCTNDSPHAYLVQLLDLCAKAKLTNLSVFSM
jgi:biopolymer transport protein ExbD